MILSLIISPHCEACGRAEKTVKDIAIRYPAITVKIINIDNYNATGISIVPALLVDEELYCYGDIDENKLLSDVLN